MSSGFPAATSGRRQAASVGNAAVGDALSRWYNLMFGVAGHGLYGGRFTVIGPYASYARPLVIRFHGDRFVPGLAVSGRATWNRTTLRVRAALDAARPRGRVRQDHADVPDEPPSRAGDRDRDARRSSRPPAPIPALDVGGVTGTVSR